MQIGCIFFMVMTTTIDDASEIKKDIKIVARLSRVQLLSTQTEYNRDLD